jgi:tetratricopeptide (TPR) repeat protein
MASHYLYIPAAGFCLLLAILLNNLPNFTFLQKTFHNLRRDLIVVILVFYSMFTITGNFFWKNNMALWPELLRYHPDNALAYNNMGGVYDAIGNTEKAMACFKKALELKPDFALSHYNLAVIYQRLGKTEDAIFLYKRAIEILPTFSQAYNNLGSIYKDLGKIEEAINLYKKAIAINPKYAGAYYNLALAYIANGQKDLAEQYYNKAKELGFDIYYFSDSYVSPKEYIRMRL